MTFDEYQRQALTTALHSGNALLDLSHWTLGLTGEAGEVAEKVKKIIRDQNATITPETKQVIAKEVGDVLWYIAVLADHLDVPLEQIAQANIDKLQSRKQRNTLTGSGDDR